MSDTEDIPTNDDIIAAAKLVTACRDSLGAPVVRPAMEPVSVGETKLVIEAAWRIMRSRQSRETTARWEAENAHKGMPFEQDTFNP